MPAFDEYYEKILFNVVMENRKTKKTLTVLVCAEDEESAIDAVGNAIDKQYGGRWKCTRVVDV